MGESIVIENDAKIPEILDRPHLLNLPDNVLKMILQMLFLRPAPLMPSKFQTKKTANEEPTTHYGYQWANTRHHLYEEGKLPQVDHVQILNLAWTSNPTDAESRSDASDITNVVLYGHFHSRRDKYREILSFEQILPIQMVILGDVCKKLNKVTLHDDDYGHDRHPYFNEKWSIEKKRAIDGSEIIDGAVQNEGRYKVEAVKAQEGDFFSMIVFVWKWTNTKRLFLKEKTKRHKDGSSF
ncbi:predicted protein [Sclerotinia sclerotiorum 1980 UF-70]|uniref:Uncharacterized protein n=1 Tax=Sclerotinia sclerotiorum (strain ATCC 18683 / 1980 / Ss-1) TaxID=665079 RepID=A7E853_SCLS1|nr:predicted protein [Sclerotinia sclerotiorum 1980 UF-70]EDN96555.1 predicted protein [Sclerotinia sclerotiorum 1980 UF-70]